MKLGQVVDEYPYNNLSYVFPIQKSELQAGATLFFPNDTKLTLEGDTEVITQIISALDGLEISFTKKENIT